MSLSALNHLKSELQRKKEDAEKKKRPMEAHHVTPMVKIEQDKESSKDTKKLPELTAEEAEKAKKARDILEAKAKLYDSLAEGIHLTKNSNLYLVNFEQKAVEDFGIRVSSSVSNQDRIIDLAKDIKDEKESETIASNGSVAETSNATEVPKTSSDKELLQKARNFSFSDLPSEKESKGTFEPTMISPAMQREKMRQKWEEDEKLARSKDDIHYQDILFDEVRSHGTGYFAFSKDEDERKRQQAELEALRQETIKKQEEFRKMRGDASDEGTSTETPDENSTNEETVRELTDEEKLKKIEEALRAIKREVHVREWDKGKEIPVMSQEEWIEKKRNERDQDFAPPEIYFENPTPNRKHKRPIQLPPKKTLFQKKPIKEDEKSAAEAGSLPSPIDCPTGTQTESTPKSESSNQSDDFKIDHASSIKSVKTSKKSAMALLEQQQNLSLDGDEIVSSQDQNLSKELSCNIRNIPLPQENNLSTNQSSSSLDSIPLPSEIPIPPPNAPSVSIKPFFIPSNLVPRKFAPPSKKVSTPPVVTPSIDLSSTLKEMDGLKKLKNPLIDPKLSHYFKEPKTQEDISIPSDEACTAESNEINVTTSSSHDHVPKSVQDNSSSTNESSRIKLGNLIRNRPAPKSGMALLEEIKKSTRDFGPEVETPHSSASTSRKRGAEIAPPECLLHSTPQLPVRKKGLFSKKEEIADSISAGLQTLKKVDEKKKKKTREKGLLDIL
nr:PREDICTED: coiled-coil domain-containing protein 174 [Bemisia tabaci]